MELINVEAQIKNSNSAFLKKLPRFIIKGLAKITYQDEINRILTKFEDSVGVDFLPKVLKELNIQVEIEGLENLPENGKCFFVANHPFGIADGLILTHTIASKYGDFRAIGNEVFVLIPQLRPIIAAVSVFDSNPKKYLQALDVVFNSEIPITHFPAGLVSRIRNWKVRDSKWHKSFVSKSVSCGRDVVPFYFYGRNSILFYTIFLIRKLLGIKANLELALLPHELFNKRNTTIRVKIGQPISSQTFDKSKSHQEWTDYVQKLVYVSK
ncbi:MAG: 1-acyl-sn-glycerol-3-phosphate acyltransferase [Prolixibacteraceae bacterium]|nr:1-acyl-sn-glycerol-3-phosphate acyltransferase [Prolixibacteraceae bacterium]